MLLIVGFVRSGGCMKNKSSSGAKARRVSSGSCGTTDVMPCYKPVRSCSTARGKDDAGRDGIKRSHPSRAWMGHPGSW
jgi:hypothetical protein